MRFNDNIHRELQYISRSKTCEHKVLARFLYFSDRNNLSSIISRLCWDFINHHNIEYNQLDLFRPIFSRAPRTTPVRCLHIWQHYFSIEKEVATLNLSKKALGCLTTKILNHHHPAQKYGRAENNILFSKIMILQDREKPETYNPQLDGIRFIAIVLVLIYHWFPLESSLNILENGPLGVTIFFVLSGFLITRILLKSRTLLSAHGFLSVYRNFMIRRILRIFPLYYAVLLFVWFARNVDILPKIQTDLYENPLYYLLYLSNFLIASTDNWRDPLSIYWTLAVEEQFYIAWPVLMLLTPFKNLKMLIKATVFAGIIARGIFFYIGDNSGVLTPTCLDSFGLGAFWAYVLCYEEEPQPFSRAVSIATPICVILFAYFSYFDSNMLARALLFRFSMSIIGVFFVVKATYGEGFKSVFGKFLSNSLVRYMGMISYGLYVCHMIVPALIMPAIIKLLQMKFGISLVFSQNEYVFASAVLLILTSVLSHTYFERYFMNLKSLFSLSLSSRDSQT